jgi:hypothetical protein
MDKEGSREKMTLKLRNIIFKYCTIPVLMILLCSLVGCAGPADSAMILRGAPTSYAESGTLELDVNGIDPIDAAEELGKSLGFKTTRSTRYAVVLTSDVASFWGLSEISSLSGKVKTVVITVYSASTIPYQWQKQDGASKQIYIGVAVTSNIVEPRKETEKILAEFKTKLTEKVKPQ